MGHQRLTPFQLAWRNLQRRPGRSVAGALAIAVAAGIAFAGALTGIGTRQSLAAGLDRLGSDLMVVPRGAEKGTYTALVMGEPAAFYMPAAVAAQVAAMPGVKAATAQVFIETLASSECCTGRVFLVGFDPQTDFTVQPWLTTHLGRTLAANEVLTGAHLLVRRGQTQRYYGHDFVVAGRLSPSGMGLDETVFITRAGVQAMVATSQTQAEQPLTLGPEQISAVLVRLQDPAQADVAARQIMAALPAVAVVTPGQVVRGVARDLGRLESRLKPVVAGILAVSLLVLGALFAAVAGERRRELALLRVLGAPAGFLVRLMLAEAALLGALSGLAGTLAGGVIFALFKDGLVLSLQLPYLWPSALQVLGLALAVAAGAALTGALAAAWPAARLARLDPHAALMPVR